MIHRVLRLHKINSSITRKKCCLHIKHKTPTVMPVIIAKLQLKAAVEK
jgi:hypothetical protein